MADTIRSSRDRTVVYAENARDWVYGLDGEAKAVAIFLVATGVLLRVVGLGIVEHTNTADWISMPLGWLIWSSLLVSGAGGAIAVNAWLNRQFYSTRSGWALHWNAPFIMAGVAGFLIGAGIIQLVTAVLGHTTLAPVDLFPLVATLIALGLAHYSLKISRKRSRISLFTGFSLLALSAVHCLILHGTHVVGGLALFLSVMTVGWLWQKRSWRTQS